MLIAALALGVAACRPATVGDAAQAGAPKPPQCRPPARAEAMAWIPPGATRIGSTRFHAEEAPVRQVEVAGFWIDSHEVTNAQYAEFVRATGYRTYAERDGNGAAVFARPSTVADRRDLGQWWRIDAKASWRHPDGAVSDLSGRDDYPVVGVTFDDALAYARWRGGDLPTEAEWERAARGGLRDAEYVWGDEARPKGRPMANHWQGAFPVANSGEDGFKGAAPVQCYAPNGYGLYDMAGNVWEMVKDRWPAADPAAPADARVIKGGSYLCSDDFCLRYRPAARQPGDPTLGSKHIGFRVVRRGPPPQRSEA